MKSFALALTPLVLATAASAAETPPKPPFKLMEVEKYGGDVRPEYGYSGKCQISSDYTDVQTVVGANYKFSNGGGATQYTDKLKDAEAVRRLIWGAEGADLTNSTGPVDGPTNFYTGIIEGKVIDLYVKLSQYYGATGQIKKNTAAGIDALEAFANRNCPEPKLP